MSSLWIPLLLGSCALFRSEPSEPPVPTEAARALRFELDESLDGLKLELSEAAAPAPAAGGGAAGAGAAAQLEALEPGAAEALFEGLPPLPYAPGDEVAFARRDDSKPPPRTGATVALSFPPEGGSAPPQVQADAPSVLRFAPEGEVPLAPHLSVTFSSPMIALTSQDEASRIRPVKLTPEPPGQWRWLGTRTLLFEPDPRFPMATEYTAEIHPETVDAAGVALAEAASWTFATPAPSVVQAVPQGGPHGLEPYVALVFDQAMPETLAEHVVLRAGSGTVALTPVADLDAIEEPWIQQLRDAHLPERTVILRPTRRLEPATNYTIEVPEGTPSAEGPRVTPEAQRFSFRTYDPLELSYAGCDRGERRCSPGGTMYLSFNNPIDLEAFDASSVSVEPAIERVRIRPQHSGVQISGALQAKTSYTVTVRQLRDTYGQALAEPVTTTFRVGDADKQLIGPPHEIVVLDPAGPPALSVFSVNERKLKVRAFAVTPDDFAAVSSWMRDARYDGSIRGQPPVRRLASELIEVPAYEDNELVETPIDLTPWLGPSGLGHVLLWIEPPTQPRERWRRIDHFVWVQRTTLGLAAVVDQDEILGWATSLATGEPLQGVTLQLLGESAEATTGTDGLATLAKYPDYAGPHALVARRGDDVALLPQSTGWWNQHGGWAEQSVDDSIAWFVFDDRSLYKPGETVSVKGWMRRYDPSAGGGVSGTAGLPDALSWTVTDSRGNKLAEGEADASDTGAFDLELELPDTPSLGTARLTLSASGGELAGGYSHTFQIQEFRRPEFEVSTQLDAGPHVLGQRAVASVHAGYYAGGALASAPVTWEVSHSPASFTPPGLSDYRFGSYDPWGWGDYGMWGRHGGYPQAYREPQVLNGTTDPAGDHRLQIEFVAVNPPRPYTVSAQATVVDVNRQRWTRSEQLLLHPARRYVGIRPDRGFYEPDDEIALDLVVADLDGALVDEVPVAVTFARLDSVLKDGRWTQVEEDPRDCAVTSAAEPARCAFVPQEGGSYRVRARITDPEGRPNETVITVWVSGGSYKQAPTRRVELEQLTLVPDQDSYQPGQTAEILVQAPFAPAEGLLVIGRNGVLRTERFRMEAASTTLEIPLDAQAVPNLAVRVEVVGSAPRRDDEGNPLPDKAERVAFAAGELSLSVPPLAQTLAVAVSPAHDAIEPGGETTIEVEVHDSAGAPVPAEIALVVVDEAVLALADRITPDPISAFYRLGGAGSHTHHSRQLVVLAEPESAGAAGDEDKLRDQLGELGYLDADDEANGAFGGGGLGLIGGGGGRFGEDANMPMAVAEEERSEAKAGLAIPDATVAPQRARRSKRENDAGGQAPSLREDFSAQALFMPHVQAGADGRATVPLSLPDSLTRYRILAVAVDADRFGVDESALTARRSLMVRPSPPRFLNFGDRAELPVVVQNQTDAPLEVSVGLRMANARALASVASAPSGEAIRAAGRRLTVPANDRVEVRFPVGTESAGRARFQAVARTSGHSDAASFDLPVWTPATSEAFATYGELDAGAVVQPVKAPSEVWPQFGGLQITTSSTAVSALTDAVLYLVQYPYDCTEQLASRVLAVAALRDVLSAFEAEQLPDPATLTAAVDADLQRIVKRQQRNGSFSFWPRSEPEPYVSVHTAHALVRAREAGFTVPERALAASMSYLDNVERHIPHWYSDAARFNIRAYALYVRHRNGKTDGAKARALFAEAGVQRLPLEGQGWLAPVLAASGRTTDVDTMLRHWNNRITETAAGAQFDVSYGDAADYVLLHSSRRTDAVLLESLIQVRPSHDVVPKVVRGLLGHRRAGRWSTTQENSFVLLALHAYFQRFEAVEPDFVARAWLGDQLAGEHAFRGRTTERATVDVPMAWLTDPGDVSDLVLAKEGEGRMYYRLGLTYAPRSLQLEPADRGFVLERSYEAVDDPADVSRDDDGTWRVRAGTRVRVRISMVSESRKTHVALTDPLPGGFEPLNPELATTGALPADPSAQQQSRYWWWMRPWFEHDNLRDERAEAFASLLYDGVYAYTYLATATTPGHFVVPPAKAEQMYEPETFGRTGTDRLIIE